ncbi:hypothetical protein VB264_02100 [Arcicella aquatica]|uniref:Uncharacterized protein n=1 Tax=Arcicella aquatica TaxID=217141 RepID=A0ABU5QHM1_9BACT|nr:hypothetical protein [Arcicella aquatica]MEA5256556.1 hypothetical protein [Arcicella aquatica]
MLEHTQNRPMTRQQLAEQLGISTKTLTRFIQKEGINISPRSLLKPKLASFIFQKFHEA